MARFSFESTSDDVGAAFTAEIQGKHVLVTGCSMGSLGFETARACARYGAALVVITGQNPERLQLAHGSLQKEGPDGNFRPLLLDLSSLAAVRAAAAEVLAYPEHIDILMNNAASNIRPTFTLTPDGFEHQLATDHLGPFLFTALIFPKLLSSTSTHVRVLWTASGAHAWGPHSGIVLSELENAPADREENMKVYDGMRAYSQAKAANIFTAREMARRLAEGTQEERRVKVFVLSPGAVNTNFVKSQTARSTLASSGIVSNDGVPDKLKLQWKTIPQGASTLMVAAFDPNLNDESGGYLRDSALDNSGVASNALDPA
ncbi:NAD(P)-binding protein [Mycena kentingensis (nom. inval.)]|nr:NAD(P)-binding protein [Mycena kentingensis (nom. inval.)]